MGPSPPAATSGVAADGARWCPTVAGRAAGSGRGRDTAVAGRTARSRAAAARCRGGGAAAAAAAAVRGSCVVLEFIMVVVAL